MSTKREQILDRVKTTLETVSTINTVEVNKMTMVDMNTIALPSAFIFPSSEERVQQGEDNAVIGRETWDLNIVIEVWTKSTTVETLLGEIHTAMYADRYLNNLADWSWRTGSELFVVDISKELWGISLSYTIRFSHPQGTP